MLFNLLADENAKPGSNWTSYLLIILVVVVLVAFFVWSAISNKKKQKQFNDTINAIKPGNKVKTIGGVCGVVVSVNDEENTFVLKTGEEGEEGCYIKFDKQAIYQTDAKAEEKLPEVAPAPAVAEEPADAVAPVVEEPADELVEEEPEEKQE